jgi:protein-S-isoprenylcysteine O-methyltransferase Ste14
VSGDGASPEVRRGVRTRFAQIAFVIGLQALLLLGGAGRWDWGWAWTYLGLSIAALGVNATVLLRRSPELVAERGRPGRMKGWDALLSALWSLASYVALPLVAGLDERFGWSGLPGTAGRALAAVVLVAGYALSGWAMAANAFFSTAVRIQSERGHSVCTTGPYRFVRHPGYVGFIVATLATALQLGSLWALMPAALAGALIVLRTAAEDRTLRAGLTGYADYARDVRYRLLPFIW